MIFKYDEFSLINEGRDADLYHWMHNRRVVDLHKDDIIEGLGKHTIKDKKYLGTSFSRNKRLDYPRSIRLVVDQAKIAANHKIMPLDGEFVYHGHEDHVYMKDRNPDKGDDPAFMNRFHDKQNVTLAEEFVLGDIKNAHRVIKSIETYEPNFQSRGVDFNTLILLQDYCEKGNIPLKENLKRSSAI